MARVDQFGEAIADHKFVRSWRSSPPGIGLALAPSYAAVNQVVNGGARHADVALLPHSHLQGVAQAQLSAPTMGVPDDSGTNVELRMRMRARYFPDPGTRGMPEFSRGEIRITVRVDQVASQVGNVIDIDLKADSVDLEFTPAWSSQPLSASGVKAINEAIRNALRTGFQPSNAVLPPGSPIGQIQFRTIRTPVGSSDVIGALLNMEEGGGDPWSAGNVFIWGGDDFALAASKDFVLRVFSGAIAGALDRGGLRQFNYSFDVVTRVWLIGEVSRTTFTYAVSLGTVTVELQDGQILLTIEGHAHTSSVLPNFDFRVAQTLTLALDGTEARVVPKGDISLTVTTGGIEGWLVDQFKGNAVAALRSIRDQVIGQIPPILNAATSVGGFLKSLMNPVAQQGAAVPQEELNPELAYTSFEIKPSGLILHGSLSVPAWPPIHVEFDAIPGTGAAAHDYSTLRSWIPGGEIDEYVWTFHGQSQPFRTDPNTFVALDPPDAPVGSLVYGYTPICVTVRGTRCSPSGPVVLEQVSATDCDWSSGRLRGIRFPKDAGGPLVALAQPGPRGLIDVVGHTLPQADESAGEAPNLIVHFADDKTAGALESLTRALGECGRPDAAAAVLAVLTASQLAKAPYAAGVIYGEDPGDGAWEQAFGLTIKRRPTTLVIGGRGDVVWRRDGELESRELGAALREHLTAGGFVAPRVLRSHLRIGHPPPNFVFPYAPGRELTLRKLVGRRVALVFWRSISAPSLEAARRFQAQSEDAEGRIVLAINDGEPIELATRVAAENGLPAILVADPDRGIALAYGIKVWPTVVAIDAFGLVREIRQGWPGGAHAASPAPTGARGPRAS
jgi:peroxiredoxin